MEQLLTLSQITLASVVIAGILAVVIRSIFHSRHEYKVEETGMVHTLPQIPMNELGILSPQLKFADASMAPAQPFLFKITGMDDDSVTDDCLHLAGISNTSYIE